MRKYLIGAVAGVSMFLVASRAQAAIGGYTGTVQFVATDWNYNRTYFGLNGTTGLCPSGQFSIDGTNPNYKESFALLAMALANGKPVSVNTDGSCPNTRANVIGVALSQ